MERSKPFVLCVRGKPLPWFSWHTLEDGMWALMRLKLKLPHREFTLRAKSSSFLFEWFWGPDNKLARRIVVPDQIKRQHERELDHDDHCTECA